MARKKFLQDLEQARNQAPAHIADIERYEGDGISFTYWFLRGSKRHEICLTLLTTNVDDYPDGNEFMLFTDDINVDTTITDSFVQLQAIIAGSSIISALREISGGLYQALTLGQAENPIPVTSSSQGDNNSEPDNFDGDNQSSGYHDDEDNNDRSFGLEEFIASRHLANNLNGTQGREGGQFDTVMVLDLTAAKDAGFKIGFHGDPSGAGIVCVSIRITKLGISEEAMQAWGLSRNQYLVLLIRFQQGYKNAAQVKEMSTLTGAVEMRVGLCDTYKPRMEEAVAAFNQADTSTRNTGPAHPLQTADAHNRGSLTQLFIGRPLNDLLRDRFPKVMKFRQQFGLSWGGAERLFNDRQGTLFSDLSREVSTYREPEKFTTARALSNIITHDNMSECEISEASLPLIAMQFVLRHFVRCTEFCLVCHCQIEATFEALKPYVCSNPLCLYQFLSLGFGPAAEWEIISQPYVVDLLVSLCYLQARAQRVREFPAGIYLKVPMLPHFKVGEYSVQPRQAITTAATTSDKRALPEPTVAFKATLNLDKNLLSTVPDSWTVPRASVTKGDWVVMLDPSHKVQAIYHCCIDDEFGFTLVLGTRIVRNLAQTSTTANTKLTQESPLVMDCYLYNQSFDDIPDQYRQHAIALLLDTLPSINHMRSCLIKQQREHRNANLNLLRGQCPRSAIDLLRWIIASNRSCIMQVDEVAAEAENLQALNPSEDRVSGMDEWMQFRFAQGAPDKEQRFVGCVQNQSKSKKYPTLFAWHGSPLYNWHSIIRQGLNFDEVQHGRANGHGVYMSPFLTTSLSYAAPRGTYVGGGSSDWPNSDLKVTSIVSLQEVVNAPDSFVSQNPHFVVANKDWIQTRYLFVRTAVRHSTGPVAKSIYNQDARYTAKGRTNEPITIPIAAISKSRRPGEHTADQHQGKKRKVEAQDDSLSAIADDIGSVITDQDDRDLLDFVDDCNDCDDYNDEFYMSDVIMTDADEVFGDFTNQSLETTQSSSGKKRSLEHGRCYILDGSKTDFVPGALDTSGIRFLPPPKYASPIATKALMRAFSDTLKVQESTPLHDLGFYIDPDRMENMYQWIVELHSFDKTLPLAQDMKTAGVTSIVFEMRFTSDFPYAPPFVRVVKPRFLDPLMGGGGHITSGGAICMELLTSSGWTAVSSIESVLFQVKLAMSEHERPARLLQERSGFQKNPYGIGEAIAAYKRFCLTHGWQIPKELDTLQSA